MQYTISLDLVNKVLSYLGSKPYNETAGIIADFNNPELFKKVEEANDTQ